MQILTLKEMEKIKKGFWAFWAFWAKINGKKSLISSLAIITVTELIEAEILAENVFWKIVLKVLYFSLTGSLFHKGVKKFRKK